MEQPIGFVKGNKNLVCKLLKSIYDLKQAPRDWYNELGTFLLSQGFKRLASEPCVFIKRDSNSIILLGVYVDDISTKNEVSRNKFIKLLQSKYKVKDIGVIKWILGMECIVTKDNISLNQSQYLEDCLKKFGFEDSKIVSTPIDPSIKLVKLKESEEELKCLDAPYREAVGCLMYLMICTRPDICLAISKVSMFCQILLKYIGQLLKGFLNI